MEARPRILRLRFPDGITARINIQSSDTMEDLVFKAQALNKLLPPFQFYSDPRHTRPYDFSTFSNGDLIFIAGTPHPNPPAAPQPRTQRPASAPQKAAAEQPPQKGEEEQPWRPPCRHGPRGMCESCMPREEPSERYAAELAKWKGRRGSSLGVMEALDALRPTIRVQEKPAVRFVRVDNDAAFGFQAYLAKTGFSQQRLGVLFGSGKDDVGDGGEEGRGLEVEVVFEPKQRGGEDTYRAVGFGGEKEEEVQEKENVVINDPMDSGSADQKMQTEEGLKRAQKLGDILGLKEVGLVISARPRKCLLSGKDVVVAAEAAVRVGSKEFVVLVVSRAEDGQTIFEAYQISDQAIDLYKRGFFLPVEAQKPNKGKIFLTKEVLVEGRETKSVHTEFFLVNVPIQSMEGGFRTKFPVENRELEPQSAQGVKKIIADKGGLPYWKRVADWHLLLFLTRVLDLDTEMAAFVRPIVEQRDFAPEEEGFKLMIDAIGNAG